MENEYHAPDTPEIDTMTEATADLMLGLIQETEVQAAQDERKCLAALVDSGAAVSLIHLQAYKLMPDTLKTAITLPG